MSVNYRHFSVAYAFSRLLHILLPMGLLAVVPAAAHGQVSTTVREGIRVTITTPAVRSAAGTVKSVTADSLFLFTEGTGATLGVATSDVTELRVSRGRSVSAGAMRGAMWGAAVGGAMGLLVVPVVLADDTYGADDGDVAAFVVQSLIGGAMWGGAIGAFVKRERWDRVTIQPTARASTRSVKLGFSVATALLH